MDYKKYPGKKLLEKNEVINKSKPIISIITPYFNSGSTIEETFNSVMNQTYPFFEWIIVDDGSKDKNSLKKLKEIEKKDSRIKVFYTNKNGGPAIARDYGIEKSSKDVKYVFFLDSDDTIDPTMLECLYWALETNPDASFAYTSVVNFGEREFYWEKYLTIELEKEDNLITVCAMVKKDDLLEVGCFGIKEKAMYEDWNLWLKLIRAGKKPLRVNAPLFWYRQTGTGELSRARKNSEEAMKYVNETAKDIKDDQVEVIQYPRYGDDFAMVNTYDMVLPDYKKDKRKTILYIFPWMVVGGADFFNLDLIKRLPQDKYRAIILTTTPSANPIRQSFEDYAEVYDMSSFMDRINYINFADYMISSRKVDLVFVSNSEYGYYMTPYLKSKYPTIPFVDYIHCVDIHDPRKGFARCSRDVTNYLSRTYCCNNSTLRELKEDFGIKDAETIYIGTDEKKFDPSKFDKKKLRDKYDIPQDKTIISFICRLSDQKRPLMFVEIAKRVCKQNSNIFWVVAGDGPLMPKVKANVDDNFKLLGMIKETEEIYALSDATFNCSSFEGLALTSYESLSMGVPIISTDAGGQAELINDSVGGLVHFNENPTPEVYEKEIEEYVEQTLRVVDNLDKLKKNCRKRIIEGFTLNLMAKKFDKIFDEVIEEEKDTKMELLDTTTYEIGCEAFNRLYFNYTNDYYERNLGIYPTAKKSKHQKLYRKITNRLSSFGAVNEGKDIVEFLRSFKRLIIEFKFFIIRFFKAIISSIKIIFKIIIKIIKKIFK